MDGWKGKDGWDDETKGRGGEGIGEEGREGRKEGRKDRWI